MTADQLKDLYDRKARAMFRRPAFARVLGQARISTNEGLSCEVEQADQMLRADAPPDDGGNGSGPHPEQLLRASVGAGLAMGYRLWAARLGVVIDRVELEITCETDLRGQLGIAADVAVGWQRVVVAVTVTSPAPDAAVRQVIATANRLSPALANLSAAIVQVHTLTIRRPERNVPSQVTPVLSKGESGAPTQTEETNQHPATKGQ